MSLRAVNFLRSDAAPRAGWWLLAAGIAALAVAQQADQHWSETRRQQEQAQRAQAEAIRVASRPKTPTVPTATQRRTVHLQRELQRPVLPVLRAVESAAVDPVYLLALSFEPSGGLRLEAEAPSFEHALAFTQVLADGHALQAATLVSHEPITDPADGRSAVRFTATARWGKP